MAKYYVCEGNPGEGITQVTPTDSPEEALKIALESTATTHFISTVNPLAEEEGEDDE